MYFPLPEYLLSWYYENRRVLPWRGTHDAYAVWVSEIMLQQTRVEAVKEYYVRFMRELPTVFDLAACDDEKLMKLWEGLGYYSRARNLKKCAVQVVNEYGGVFPREKEKLLKLPGIGDYTSGSVSSIAYDEKNPAIDGNVLRVCARVQGNYAPIDDAARKKELYKMLQNVYPEEAGDYTQSLMELGALVCTPDVARCDVCPMSGNCIAERDNLQGKLPVIPKKADKKKSSLLVCVIHCNGKIFIRKRPSKGVLAGMWEFPNVDVSSVPTIEQALASYKIGNYKVIGQKKHTHVFTHLIWEMTAYRVECEDVPPMSEFTAVTAEQLQSEVSLATAFRWCLELV